MASEGEILTVGHSNHEETEFVELLRGAGIELIADVRRYPGSRRQPHFERTALAAVLLEAGIGYRWLGETLGGRRRPVANSVNGAWESDQFRFAGLTPCPRLTFPIFGRVRADKDIASGGARLEQLVKYPVLPSLDKRAAAKPESTVAAMNL